MKTLVQALALACMPLAAASAHVALPKIVRATDFEGCPGGTEWIAQRRDEERASVRSVAPTKPGLRAELLQNSKENVADAAQVSAEAAAIAAAAAGDVEASAQLERNARGHQSTQVGRLRQLLATEGIPTVEQIGSGGMLAFVDLLRSASSEPNLQIETAEAMLKASSPAHDRWMKRGLVEIIDKALAVQQKPQRYGTLFDVGGGGAIVPKTPIEDEAGLADRRAAAGLPPMSLELCIRGEHGSEVYWPPMY